MTIRYSILPSVDDGSGHDRKYVAADYLARPSRDFLAGEGNGVSREIGSSMEVTETSPASLAVSVGTGVARANGWRFEIFNAAEEVALDTADASDPRIDRIIVRVRLGSSNRDIILTKLTGTPAASPSAPALTQSGDTYEISLAQVTVGAGVSSVSNTNITDERDWLQAQDSKLFDGKSPSSFLQVGTALNLGGQVLRGHNTNIITITSATTLNNGTHRGSLLEVNGVALSLDPQSTTAYDTGHQTVVTSTASGGCTVSAPAGVTINGVDGGTVTIGQWEAFPLIYLGSDAWIMPNAGAE